MKNANKRQVLGFDDTWLTILGIPMVSLIMPLLVLPSATKFTFELYRTSFLISLFQTPFYWFIFRFIFIKARYQFPAFSDTLKRISFQLFLVGIVYILLDPILGYMCNVLIVGKEHIIGGITLKAATMVMILLWIAIYEGIYFYQQLKKSIQEKEQLQRENIQSQLESLKTKVSPHFLFNSLNTLSYLIPEDAEKSVKFVQKLSKVYRYILEMSDEKLIPLSKELEFLNAYIFLLKERFEDNLQVNIKIPPSRMHDQIIPLSLQILVENAIKHNVISSAKPLKIKVLINEVGKLVVENNLQKKKLIRPSTNFGLSNIKNRYHFFSEEAVDINTTPTSFVVSLPLIAAKG